MSWLYQFINSRAGVFNLCLMLFWIILICLDQAFCFRFKFCLISHLHKFPVILFHQVPGYGGEYQGRCGNGKIFLGEILIKEPEQATTTEEAQNRMLSEKISSRSGTCS